MSDEERRERDDRTFHYHLYDVALEMYRYIHTDVWSGQKYYTSLNVAVITVGFGLIGALLKLQPLPSYLFWIVLPIFVIGLITSFLGFVTIKKLRRSFLEAIWFKIAVEEALQPELNEIRNHAIEIRNITDAHRDRFLTPVYCLKEGDRDDALRCPKQWIERNMSRRWGVVWCFIQLQIVFFAINIIGILIVAWLTTLSF